MRILKNMDRRRICVLFCQSNHVELEDWYNSVSFFGHIREYTLKEVKLMLAWVGFLFMMLYLVIPMFIRGLRYNMIVIGQKQKR